MRQVQTDPATPSKPAGLRRFLRAEDGATAVEFGIVSVPFFGLFFAIIQIGFLFFASQTLETAVDNAARTIRTGQAQQQNLNQAQFKEKICSVMRLMIADCTTSLMLDVRTYPNFTSIDLSNPLGTTGAVNTTNFGFTPGHGGDIVVVRAYYEWPVWATFLNFDLRNTKSNKHLIAAIAAFRNEPFPW